MLKRKGRCLFWLEKFAEESTKRERIKKRRWERKGKTDQRVYHDRSSFRRFVSYFLSILFFHLLNHWYNDQRLSEKWGNIKNEKLFDVEKTNNSTGRVARRIFLLKNILRIFLLISSFPNISYYNYQLQIFFRRFFHVRSTKI